MSPSRALFLAASMSAFAACNCQPPVVNSCDPARCAGCCVNGKCTSCSGQGGGGGGGTGGGVSGGGTGGGVSGGGTGGGVTGGGTGGGVTGGGTGGGVTGGGTGGGTTGGGTGGGTTGGGTGGGTTGGGTGGGTTGGGGGTIFVDFDGGWQIQQPPRNPAMNGNNTTVQDLGPGVDGGAPTRFGGAMTGPRPTVVYPPDGVIFPPNTNRIEFHFLPGSGQTTFRLTFRAPTRTVEVYTGCTSVGGGCIYTLDATAYADLVPYARGTAPVSWDVAGVDGAGTVGVSLTHTLSFTEQDIIGGLYYWNSAGTVMRFDYGFPNSPPQTFITGANVGALTCVGCHVISRQGNLLVVGKDIPAPAAYSTLNVQTKMQVNSMSGPLTGSANFFSFAPNEQHMLQSNGVKIEWRDLFTGVVRQVTPLGAMPDWSPSGTSMVFSKPASAPPFGFAVPGVDSASLQTMHFNGSGFDPPQALVPFSGQNNYYPAWSPDGLYVLFNRSPSNRNSFDNAAPSDAGYPDGELWAVQAVGGTPTPVRLTNASAPGATQWPKWAPMLHNYSGGHVMWLTFSSQRAYGLRLADWEKTQLWMVAFDPVKMSMGQDPSFSAFWLPFQDISSGNHIGQWSTAVPRANCTGSGQSTCAVGEVCSNGKCRPG